MADTAQRFYRISGITYCVCCPADYMYDADRQLSPFRIEPAPWDHRITFFVADTLPLPQEAPIWQQSGQLYYRLQDGLVVYTGVQDPYMRAQFQGNETLVQVRRSGVPGRITIKLVLSAMFFPNLLISDGGFMLHASYIRHGDRAILFTAPSGTGKSTQADLWASLRGAELLNGDRCAVMTGPDGVHAHGVPFCGSSGVSKNVSLPLAAIVYLSQAPTTTITRLKGLQAFRSVWEGVSVDLWNRKDTTACTDLVLEVASQVPVFHLACTPDESAVIAVERAIQDLR
jgi:hypothetical protein